MDSKTKIRGFSPTDRMAALGVTGVFFDPINPHRCQIEYLHRETGQKVTEFADQHVAQWIVGLAKAPSNG